MICCQGFVWVGTLAAEFWMYRSLLMALVDTVAVVQTGGDGGVDRSVSVAECVSEGQSEVSEIVEGGFGDVLDVEPEGEVESRGAGRSSL